MLSILISSDSSTFQFKNNIIDINHELDDYYRYINCSTIDIILFNDYALIIDDEGLLKSANPVIEIHHIYQSKESIELAGNVIVARVDEKNTEELRGLTKAEIIDFHSQYITRLIGMTT